MGLRYLTPLKTASTPFTDLFSAVFNGTTSKVNVGTGASLNVDYHSTAASCGAWIYPTALASLSENVILSNAAAAPTFTGLMFLVNGAVGNDLAVYLSNNYGTSNTIACSVSFTFSINTWYHVGFTTDGSGGQSSVKMYINGASQTVVVAGGNNLTASTASANPMLIGSPNVGSFGIPFQGNMDEVFFINGTQLSDADFTAIYNGGTPTSLSSYSPTSWWRFENDVTDTMGLNNGTATAISFSANVP